MPEEIHRKLEDVPLDIKYAFNTIQTAEEAEQLEHGDYVALYNTDGSHHRRNEHRWIRMGRYDEIEEKVRAEYFLNYETSTRKLGAQVNLTARRPDGTDSRVVKVPEKVYEDASESLNEVL